jgi:hypothetical protein
MRELGHSDRPSAVRRGGMPIASPRKTVRDIRAATKIEAARIVRTVCMQFAARSKFAQSANT